MQFKVHYQRETSLKGVRQEDLEERLARLQLLRHRQLRSVKNIRKSAPSRPRCEAHAETEVVRGSMRDWAIYVVRRRDEESNIAYCEVSEPSLHERHSFEPVLTTQTDRGTWRIFLMTFDFSLGVCSRIPLWRWKFVDELKGDDSVVAALRYALES